MYVHVHTFIFVCEKGDGAAVKVKKKFLLKIRGVVMLSQLV